MNGSVYSVYIEVFGCQMNKLDADLMRSGLADAGFALAESPGEATALLIHTCSVREHAEEKVYSKLGVWRQRKEKEPGLILGVVGCMAQRVQDQLFRRAPYVDLVCGTDQFARLPELLRAAQETNERQLAVEQTGGALPQRDMALRPRKAQAFVSVMRGCNYACTYCIVPTVRGPERSRDETAIVDEVKRLADDGVKEVTFLGQTVNAYGKGTDHSFPQLLERTHAIDGICRIRFVTSHPNDMTDELIDTVTRLPKVCNSVSLPVQSGSNRILKRMKRLYSVERYEEIVGRLRDRAPDFEILTDFIVGFPGETEADFDASAALMRRIAFQTAFVFKYSTRPGTPATRLEDDVPRPEKERRNHELLRIQNEIAEPRNRALVGRTLELLVEGPTKRNPERLNGRTPGNRIVVFDGDPALAGELIDVRITDATALSLRGEWCATPAGL